LLAQFGGKHWPAIAKAQEFALMHDPDDPTDWRAVSLWIMRRYLPPLV